MREIDEDQNLSVYGKEKREQRSDFYLPWLLTFGINFIPNI
jgi:hypothetical protein